MEFTFLINFWYFKGLIRSANSYLGRVSYYKDLQRPKLDIFQEALFCTLASSTNLALKVIPIEAGQYLCRVLSCFYQKLIVFKSFAQRS